MFPNKKFQKAITRLVSMGIKVILVDSDSYPKITGFGVGVDLNTKLKNDTVVFFNEDDEGIVYSKNEESHILNLKQDVDAIVKDLIDIVSDCLIDDDSLSPEWVSVIDDFS